MNSCRVSFVVRNVPRTLLVTIVAPLLDATHRQTQVLRLDHDADAVRIQSILQEVGDLLRHALLDLQTPGEHLDDSWDL